LKHNTPSITIITHLSFADIALHFHFVSALTEARNGGGLRWISILEDAFADFTEVGVSFYFFGVIRTAVWAIQAIEGHPVTRFQR